MISTKSGHRSGLPILSTLCTSHPQPLHPMVGVSGNESGSLANDLAQLRAELSGAKDPEEQKRRMEQRKERMERGVGKWRVYAWNTDGVYNMYIYIYIYKFQMVYEHYDW